MRSCQCDPGYTCCSENVPSGSPTFGMCVKNGFCDPERGIPKKGCSGGVSDTRGLPADSVKILEFSHEGYDSDCSSWNSAMIIMVVVVVLLLALGVFLWKPRRN